MIIISQLQNGKFVKHESDSNKMILQVETGILYRSAVDLAPCRYIYEETDVDAIPADQKITNKEFFDII